MRILFFDIGEIDYKGVELLSAVLKEKGHTVDLLLDPGFGKHYYLKIPLLNSIISDKLLLDKALSFKPDLIGMSIVTNNFQYFRAFGQKLKQVMDVPIIVGGIHPTSVPDEVIKESWVDMLCVGDGEEAMVELAEKMEQKQDISHIKNLWVKDNNGNIHKNDLRPLTSDIDSLSFPDLSIYAQYGVLGKRIRVMTGRGCAHKCTFCVNSFRNDLYPDQKYLRKHSVDYVIRLLKEIKNKYKPKAFRFEDDVFVLNRQWLSDFKIRYRNEISLPFHCYITPTGVKQEIINDLKEAGCHSIAMGIQSGNNKLRSDIMSRHYTNETVIEAAHIIRESGLKLYAEYMFGLPGETPEMMWETMRLTEHIKANNTWASIFYPYPKTVLGDFCKQLNFITPEIESMIAMGEGNPHSMSILNHPHAKDAFKFKALLPLYAALPKPFRKPFRKMFRKKYGFMHRFIFIISIPLLEKKEFFFRFSRLPLIITKTLKVLRQR